MVNTAIDAGLFIALHGPLGVFWANFVSTSTGMLFSFVANGRYTFGDGEVSLRRVVRFLLTNALTMWVLQPLVISGVLSAGHHLVGDHGWLVPLAKLIAIGCSFCVNFVSYRFLVWRPDVPAPQADRA